LLFRPPLSPKPICRRPTGHGIVEARLIAFANPARVYPERRALCFLSDEPCFQI